MAGPSLMAPSSGNKRLVGGYDDEGPSTTSTVRASRILKGDDNGSNWVEILPVEAKAPPIPDPMVVDEGFCLTELPPPSTVIDPHKALLALAGVGAAMAVVTTCYIAKRKRRSESRRIRGHRRPQMSCQEECQSLEQEILDARLKFEKAWCKDDLVACRSLLHNLGELYSRPECSAALIRDTKHEEQALGELEDYLDWLRQSLRHAVQGKEEEKLLRSIAEWAEVKEAGGLVGILDHDDGLVGEAEEELESLYHEEDHKDMMEIEYLRRGCMQYESSANGKALSTSGSAPENPTRRALLAYEGSTTFVTRDGVSSSEDRGSLVRLEEQYGLSVNEPEQDGVDDSLSVGASSVSMTELAVARYEKDKEGSGQLALPTANCLKSDVEVAVSSISQMMFYESQLNRRNDRINTLEHKLEKRKADRKERRLRHNQWAQRRLKERRVDWDERLRQRRERREKIEEERRSAIVASALRRRCRDESNLSWLLMMNLTTFLAAVHVAEHPPHQTLVHLLLSTVHNLCNDSQQVVASKRRTYYTGWLWSYLGGPQLGLWGCYTEKALQSLMLLTFCYGLRWLLGECGVQNKARVYLVVVLYSVRRWLVALTWRLLLGSKWVLILHAPLHLYYALLTEAQATRYRSPSAWWYLALPLVTQAVALYSAAAFVDPQAIQVAWERIVQGGANWMGIT